MQVFISWSGEQSHAVALALRVWLPKVLAQKVKPFVSSEDIEKGARGLSVIANELDQSGFGVVVVTPSNQQSAWVNFEAGALGKSVTDGKVAPLLVGLTDAEVDGPLKQFQNSSATDREAVLALVLTMNKYVADPLPADAVNTLFQAAWPELETAIRAALAVGVAEPAQARDPADLLDEVLTTVRSLQRNVSRLSSKVEGLARDEGGGGLRDRDGDDSFERTLSSMIFRSGAKGWSFTSGGGSYDITLDDKAPEMGQEILRDLQELAKSQGTNLTILRPDGAWVSFDGEGKESRGTGTGTGTGAPAPWYDGDGPDYDDRDH